MRTKLTEKQRRFVEEYMASANATDAARKAGYEGNDVTLASMGAETLRKPLVRDAINARVAADPRIANRQARQLFWTQVMHGDVGYHQVGHGREAYEKPGADMADRLKASELLGRSHADFVDRQELTGKDGKAIQVVGMSWEDIALREHSPAAEKKPEDEDDDAD